jgi:hypothetical protein
VLGISGAAYEEAEFLQQAEARKAGDASAFFPKFALRLEDM